MTPLTTLDAEAGKASATFRRQNGWTQMATNTERKLTGKISAERIKLYEAPRPPEGLIERFKALGDASGVISDTLDELGITGIIGASTLRPTISGTVIVGPALTIRSIVQRAHPYESAKEHVNGMAEFEAHNLAL